MEILSLSLGTRIPNVSSEDSFDDSADDISEDISFPDSSVVSTDDEDGDEQDSSSYTSKYINSGPRLSNRGTITGGYYREAMCSSPGDGLDEAISAATCKLLGNPAAVVHAWQSRSIKKILAGINVLLEAPMGT